MARCARERQALPASLPRPRATHLDGEVDEAADVEGVLHQVEDELDVLHQGQVVGHP